MSQQMVQENAPKTVIVGNVEYEVCECCGKPKRGTGKTLGAPAVWVVKSFVKNGKLVDFPAQWAALCEACGFRVIHIHRALLVKDNGTALTLDGGAVTKTVARKSFFRRLAESKGSPPIDYETVLCTVRV